jgi:enoyl-CoA hydratase/carnithine racemase
VAGATLDPRLLVPSAGRSPAQLVAGDLGGEAAVLRVEGGASAWSEVAGLGAGDQAEVRRSLAHVVALTMAVAPEPLPVTRAFDLWTADPAEADRWEKGFGRAPRAALAAALLTRALPGDTWSGLVAESTTYSLLQAGPEFGAWLANRPPRPAVDTGPRVRSEWREGRCEIVLTRPDRHNALDARMRDELHAALEEARSRSDGTIVLSGEGPSFCSGGDLGEFGTAPGPVESHAVRLGRSLALLFAEMADRIVVGIHGSCLGAGIELPAFSRRVVAADDCRIGLPELDIGLVPGAGGTVSIPRRAGSPVLLDLLLSGGTVDASTALARGLVDEVVPRSQLPARIRDLASDRR